VRCPTAALRTSWSGRRRYPPAARSLDFPWSEESRGRGHRSLTNATNGRSLRAVRELSVWCTADEGHRQGPRDGARFAAHEIGLLVATTVVESRRRARGTIMVIENADRFGLAHCIQLRGRMARRGSSTFCCSTTSRWRDVQSPSRRSGTTTASDRGRRCQAAREGDVLGSGRAAAGTASRAPTCTAQ